VTNDAWNFWAQVVKVFGPRLLDWVDRWWLRWQRWKELPKMRDAAER
jgi:hypothetical protein